MLDILDDVLAARRAGHAVALAVVVATWSSSPRPVGSAMAVVAALRAGSAEPAERVLGSVSGGCVEGDLHARLTEVLDAGRTAPEPVRYGVSDDDALGVGLTCGGTLDVLVQAVDDDLTAALARLAAQRDGSGAAHGDGVLRLALDDHVVVVREGPPPELLVAGAGPLAAAVAAQARLLGHRTTVVDARAAFATQARHPHADEVVVDWPHRHLAALAAAGRAGPGTALVVLTHEARFDLPLLEVALRLDLGYVGAMGSRPTCARRHEQLRARGLTEAELGRLHAPVGLDLGGHTPAEVALSIAAEVLAVHRRRSGGPLRSGTGPVTARRTASPAEDPHRVGLGGLVRAAGGPEGLPDRLQ